MLFRALIGAYALNTLAHIAAILLLGERWPFIAFMNTFAHLLWLPTLVLLPLCLILREWRLAGMLLPATIAFLLVWGDMLLPPNTSTVDDDAIMLRVMTANLYADNLDLTAFIEAVNTIEPDVIALQELDERHIATLERELGTRYPNMALHPNRFAGQGILSTFSIVEDMYWQHDFLPNPLGHQRVLLEVAASQQVVVYNVHPTHPGLQGALFDPSFRTREIDALLDRTATEDKPILIVGDFNMPDFSNDYRHVRQSFQDAYREGGFGLGWTYPRLDVWDFAVLRLDYIFIDEAFQTISATIWPVDYGSDHHLLYADLWLILTAYDEP